MRCLHSAWLRCAVFFAWGGTIAGCGNYHQVAHRENAPKRAAVVLLPPTEDAASQLAKLHDLQVSAELDSYDFGPSSHWLDIVWSVKNRRALVLFGFVHFNPNPYQGRLFTPQPALDEERWIYGPFRIELAASTLHFIDLRLTLDKSQTDPAKTSCLRNLPACPTLQRIQVDLRPPTP